MPRQGLVFDFSVIGPQFLAEGIVQDLVICRTRNARARLTQRPSWTPGAPEIATTGTFRRVSGELNG